MTESLDGLSAQVRDRVDALGFELVDLRKRGAGRRVSLQIRIDRLESESASGVSTGDCALVSRELERWFDETAILGLNYVLEVSSPGIERPVRWPEHWQRYVGREVTVRIPDLGRVRAKIVRVVESRSVVFSLPDRRQIEVLLSDARDARLVVDWSTIERPL